MLRYLTAGESHGRALVATIEGLPAHVRVSTEAIGDALARRRLGVGRGARMKFERDEVTILTGVRHGVTLGSPIAVMTRLVTGSSTRLMSSTKYSSSTAPKSVGAEKPV